MAALIFLFLNLVASLFKSKSRRLEAEDAALRRQLIVLQRKVRGRVQFTTTIACSSSSCIVGFHRSSRPSRSFGQRPWCAGIVPIALNEGDPSRLEAMQAVKEFVEQEIQ